MRQHEGDTHTDSRLQPAQSCSLPAQRSMAGHARARRPASRARHRALAPAAAAVPAVERSQTEIDRQPRFSGSPDTQAAENIKTQHNTACRMSGSYRLHFVDTETINQVAVNKATENCWTSVNYHLQLRSLVTPSISLAESASHNLSVPCWALTPSPPFVLIPAGSGLEYAI
ncbi:hypothetical protein chiPu_0013390 [Chiloscyllium punctatum]|uniref:Uncharacterized protein n=1 Tax=Chiloscyllium punctatum TaxID=137246 RepID=A0A401SX04_CHIPU|nr:hypothetical protein [Chiloscyllium punctatum]